MHHRIGWTLVEMMVAILIISILAGLTLSIGSAVLASSEVRQTEDSLKLLNASLLECEMLMGREPTFGKNGEPRADSGALRGSRYDVDLQLTLEDGNGCNCPGGLGSVMDYTQGSLPSEQQLVCSQWCQVSGCTGTGSDVFEGNAAFAIQILCAQPASRAILSQMSPDLLEKIMVLTNDSSGDQMKEAVRPVDAWGNPILIVFPGRERLDGEGGFSAARFDEDGTVRTKAEQVLGVASNRNAYFVSAGPDGKFGSIDFDESNITDWESGRDVTDVRYRHTLDNVYSYKVRSW
jgi:prepilin-type N-terminal cleavage/methylation domain-containing protein